MAKRHGDDNNLVHEDKVHERRIRRLPKNFGCIRYLGPGRRNPYAVHKGSGGNGDRGADGKTRKRPRAICYVPDWETGYKVLILAHAGVYKKGMERDGFQNCRFSSNDVGEKFILYAKKAMKDLEILRSGGSIPGLYNDVDNNADVLKSIEEAETEITSDSIGSAEKEALTGPIEAAKRKERGRSDRPEGAGKSGGCVACDQYANVGKSGKPVVCEQDSDAEQGGHEHRRSFEDVFNSFFNHKFGTHAQRKLSRQTRNSTNAAWKKLSSIKEQTLDEVDIDRLESLVNGLADAGYSKSTVDRVVTLIHQLYRYALTREYCRNSCGLYLERPAAKEEVHHQAFSDSELAKIWDAYHTSVDIFVRDVCRMILINCYSGFRIREFETMEIHMSGSALVSDMSWNALNVQMPGNPPGVHESGTSGIVPASRMSGAKRENEGRKSSAAYFRGGLKTEAGRNRIVPIHSAILPLVGEITSRGTDADGAACTDCSAGRVRFLCGKGHNQYRRDMKAVLLQIGVDGVMEDGVLRHHTPHSCRHTFSRLCESYGVKEADRKRLMGHSFGNDITNRVYGHRSVEELQTEIEKIRVLNYR